MKKILFLTGTRADFGKIKPLLKRVKESDEFQLDLVVTGMHLVPKFGLTVNEITKSGFSKHYSFKNQLNNQSSSMDVVLAKTVRGLSDYVKKSRPDMIVVHGDRVETLAGAIVGSLNNILVGHIEGGEVTGTVDELIRHATTKMSHIHFVSNQSAKKRLVQMGENKTSIFVIGSPDIDVMLSTELPKISAVRRRYEIPFNDYAILLYHPVTTELHLQKKNTQILRKAIKDSKINYVIISPNNDLGASFIFKEWKKISEKSWARILPSMRFEFFLTLLKYSSFIIGNSSAGIREAPVYGVPCINIGTRQKNRSSSTEIINTKDDYDQILNAIKHVPKKTKISHEFGRGDSARRFMKALGTNKIWKIRVQKRFNDLT